MHGRYDGEAYFLAREQALRLDGRQIWFWTCAAITLAHLEGQEIGMRAGDCWR